MKPAPDDQDPDPGPGRPNTRPLVLDLVLALSDLLAQSDESTTVAMLLSRPGRDRPGAADRRWAQVLTETARRAGGADRTDLPDQRPDDRTAVSATVCYMERVGLRELRQHASRYVDRVAGGESLEIAVRGRPVAHAVSWRSNWDDMIARGEITPPSIPGDLLDGHPAITGSMLQKTTDNADLPRHLRIDEAGGDGT